MENFDVFLSRKEIDLILICLSSCAGQCYLFGNISLAHDYIDLHGRLQGLIH